MNYVNLLLLLLQKRQIYATAGGHGDGRGRTRSVPRASAAAASTSMRAHRRSIAPLTAASVACRPSIERTRAFALTKVAPGPPQAWGPARRLAWACAASTKRRTSRIPAAWEYRFELRCCSDSSRSEESSESGRSEGGEGCGDAEGAPSASRMAVTDLQAQPNTTRSYVFILN